MEIHSNSPQLYYGFNIFEIHKVLSPHSRLSFMSFCINSAYMKCLHTYNDWKQQTFMYHLHGMVLNMKFHSVICNKNKSCTFYVTFCVLKCFLCHMYCSKIRKCECTHVHVCTRCKDVSLIGRSRWGNSTFCNCNNFSGITVSEYFCLSYDCEHNSKQIYHSWETLVLLWQSSALGAMPPSSIQTFVNYSYCIDHLLKEINVTLNLNLN